MLRDISFCSNARYASYGLDESLLNSFQLKTADKIALAFENCDFYITGETNLDTDETMLRCYISDNKDYMSEYEIQAQDNILGIIKQELIDCCA